MKNIIFLSFLALTVFISCGEDKKDKKDQYPPITKVFEAYYQDNLKLNPIKATEAGDNRYNDTLPNNLSEAFLKKEKELYTNYKKKLNDYEDSELSPEDKMTKDVLLWDCNVNLSRLQFKKYTPIDQMWSLNLKIGQFASGASAQPFKTVDDYTNWLSRIDDYLEWLASTEINMRAGIKEGNVLPKSLIKKVLPQLKAMTVEDVDKHLFYSPVKNFPDTFSEEDKLSLKDAYAQMITEKIIPAYQKLHDFMNSEYMDAGRTTAGVVYIPNGKDYYKHQIKYYTT
ncbi:MAG: DUF885 family protein, partial [Flavobacteriaceae bacterium]|nr:DUF885 family protein [Flavobacteriaceae bacterium]